MTVRNRKPDSLKRSLYRVWRYSVIPAMIALVDALLKYTTNGSFEVDWKLVVAAALTAALAGFSKWLREELEVDVKVV